MGLSHLGAQWAVWRTFGTPGRVVAETPRREPVVAIERDRVVLRRADRRFWLAARCPSCAAETASADLQAHQDVCGRPDAASDRRWRASPRLPGSPTARRPRVSPQVLNRSSARVFGRNQTDRSSDLILLVVAVAIALALVAVVGTLSS